jgi:hypothetical protein
MTPQIDTYISALGSFYFSWLKQAKHKHWMIFMIEPPFFIKHIWLPSLTTSCHIRIASNKTQVELQLKLDIWVRARWGPYHGNS